jgi:hypothetical protein
LATSRQEGLERINKGTVTKTVLRKKNEISELKIQLLKIQTSQIKKVHTKILE